MYKDISKPVHYLEQQINISRNQEELDSFYDQMKWLRPDEAEILSREREQLLEYLLCTAGATAVYNDTKLDGRNLSPGCRMCASGEWSCLFINNKCNAACFYCPSEQNEVSEPATNNFTFSKVEDYIAYLEKFGFKGCSLSGGEPLLTFEKTLHYVTNIKKHFGSGMYMWLYTNGILSNQDKLEQLARAGLDEIRFDIGATAFKTDKACQAVGIIPRVTVEIPAVPNEYEKIIQAATELAGAGVNHLNLHQLRCTAYNREKLVKKGLTFMHAPRVLVAQSEVTALKIMKFILENKLPLPVNYCSFVFKNSHQNKAARSRGLDYMLKATELATRAAFIRQLIIRETPERLEQLARYLDQIAGQHQLTPLYHYNPGEKSFYPLAGALPYLKEQNLQVLLNYHFTTLMPSVSYRFPYKEVLLDTRKKMIVEKVQVLRDFHLEPHWFDLFAGINECNDEEDFYQLLMRESARLQMNDEVLTNWLKIKEYEFMKKGLQAYY